MFGSCVLECSAGAISDVWCGVHVFVGAFGRSVSGGSWVRWSAWGCIFVWCVWFFVGVVSGVCQCSRNALVVGDVFVIGPVREGVGSGPHGDGTVLHVGPTWYMWFWHMRDGVGCE